MSERYWLTGAQLETISKVVRQASPDILEIFGAWDLLKQIEYDQPIEGAVVFCRECGVKYEELGLDIVLPYDQWLMIHPEDSGILCGSCIAKRAAKLPRAIAIRAYIEFAPARREPQLP